VALLSIRIRANSQHNAARLPGSVTSTEVKNRSWSSASAHLATGICCSNWDNYKLNSIVVDAMNEANAGTC
jgi:hypothetical protein